MQRLSPREHGAPEDDLALFSAQPAASSYMIVRMGDDESIQELRVQLIGDATNQGLMSGNRSAAVWKNHLLIASKEALYYFDLTEYFDRMS